MKNLLILFSFLFIFENLSAQVSNTVDQQYTDVIYNKNGGFENGKAGWTVYNDGSVAVPVDCNGGTATVAVGSSTASPIQGKSSGTLTKPASNVQGQGYATDFTLDKASKSKIVNISGSYEIVSGTYSGGTQSTDSDIELYIYDTVDAKIIQPTGYKLDGGVSGYTYNFTAQFQSPQFSTDTRTMRLCVHHATTSASAFQLKLDQVKIGLQPKAPTGAIITEWQDFPSVSAGTLITATTSNPTFGTIVVNKAQYRYVGGDLEIKWDFRQNSSGTAGSGDYLFNIPSSICVIDTARASTNSTAGLSQVNSGSLGQFKGESYATAGTNLVLNGPVYAYSSSQLRAQVAAVGSSGYNSSTWNSTSQSTGYLGNSSLSVSLNAKVPCVGKSGYVSLSTGDDLKPFFEKATGNYTGGSGVDSTIILPTSAQSSHGSYNTATGEFTAHTSTNFLISGFLAATTNNVNIRAFVDGVLDSTVGYTTNSIAVLSGSVFLKAGQKLTLKSQSSIGASIGSSSVIVYTNNGRQQLFSSDPIFTRYNTSSGQSIPTGTVTIVNYDNRSKDNTLSVVTGASWKFSSPTPGDYDVSANLGFASAAGGGSLYIYIYKNGVEFSRNYIITSATAAPYAISIKDTVPMNAGDYIDIRVFQNAGVARTLDTSSAINFVSIKKSGI